MDKILHDLIYLNYGIYGTIIYLSHAEFCPSTVWIALAEGSLGSPATKRPQGSRGDPPKELTMIPNLSS